MSIDLDALVIGPCMEVFGEAAVYTPPTGLPLSITGVFDEAYLELAPLGRGGLASESFGYGSVGSVTTETPVLGVQLSQFPMAPEQGGLLKIRNTDYTIREVRTDGHGGAKLLLNLYPRRP